MRRLIAVIVATCALVFAFTALPGCGDDVKKVEKTETHTESQPQMVSPGEPIVE